jgi:hypothetical protein
VSYVWLILKTVFRLLWKYWWLALLILILVWMFGGKKK